MPRSTSPTVRRKKLIEEFNRQKDQELSHGKIEFKPIKRFTNESAVKEVDKWYSSLRGGTSFEE
jgi:hypothetical protein